MSTIPKHNPIPAGVTKPVQWRYYLAGLMDCFANKTDAPDWLVDAFFDATFDPQVVAAFERTKGAEPG